MNEKKIRVAVLFGGVSSEHEISLMSVQSVLRNMPEDYEVLTIGITKDGRWVEYTGSIDEITDQKWEQDKNLRTAVISPDRSHKGILLIDKDQVTVVPVDICFRQMQVLRLELERHITARSLSPPVKLPSKRTTKLWLKNASRCRKWRLQCWATVIQKLPAL